MDLDNITAEGLAETIESMKGALRTQIDNYNEALDTIWMLVCASLVFFMHSGFSLLEAGCVRQKNTQNILAKNLIVVTVGFMCWYFVGYALAFGAPERTKNKFIGGANFVMDEFWDHKSSFRVWYFQGVFCATGATIVSGAMAERTKLFGFIIYTVIMTSLIYPVVVWWGWSGHGFLSNDGKSNVGPSYIDFAGSGVVHLVGGIGALCGAVIVGPRAGRWEPEREEEFEGHSIPFCVLGTLFLWFGWYGFNPGSTLEMHTADMAHKAGLVAVNTTLAPCVAGLLVFFLRAKLVPPKHLDVGAFCNGILAGLVAITAPCGVVKPWESIVIGFIGGLAYVGVSVAMKKMKVDDVVDAFAVHGANGLWGIIASGWFGDPEEGIGGLGCFYGGEAKRCKQLGTQCFAAFIIILWVGSLSSAIMFSLKKVGALRLSDAFQEAGADAMEHSPRKAYSNHASPIKETAL